MTCIGECRQHNIVPHSMILNNLAQRQNINREEEGTGNGALRDTTSQVIC